jgi:hypothetical protein
VRCELLPAASARDFASQFADLFLKILDSGSQFGGRVGVLRQCLPMVGNENVGILERGPRSLLIIASPLGLFSGFVSEKTNEGVGLLAQNEQSNPPSYTATLA